MIINKRITYLNLPLSGKLKIALTDISLTHNWNNVSYKFDNNIVTIINTVREVKTIQHIIMPEGYYSLTNYVEVLTQELTKLSVTGFELKFHKHSGKLDVNVRPPNKIEIPIIDSHGRSKLKQVTHVLVTCSNLLSDMNDGSMLAFVPINSQQLGNLAKHCPISNLQNWRL